MKQEPVIRWNRAAAAFPDDIAPARAAEANPFYAAPLLGPALAYLDPERAVHLLEARDAGGRLLARMPVRRHVRHGRFAIIHCANWVHPHCYYGAPVLRIGKEAEGWRALLTQLDDAHWAGDFLHLRLVDPDGPAVRALVELCAAEQRPVREVARHERALLASDATAEAYWASTIRTKKRKELRRQHHRLDEAGEIGRSALTDPADLLPWCEDFLSLERSGWKGAGGTALASCRDHATFFREACRNAFAAGALDMLRIDCDGRAIAMLVNFVGPGGGFSFKIAIDPAFARFSPGVLVERDNLTRVLDERRAPWMDSCAAPGHPMIDSLWGERRAIAQYRIALRKGPRAALRRAVLSGTEAAARRLRAAIPR